MRNIFMYPVEALNVVKSNVWGVILIAVGSALVMHNKGEVGTSLVTGGFAILRAETAAPVVTPAQLPDQVKDPKAQA